MGFDAVWISPVTKQLEGVTAYGEAYHAYWQTDIYSINSHFGSEDDLKALSAALHARGMVSSSSKRIQPHTREEVSANGRSTSWST